MGIRSVAVYSDIDRAALHVRKADEAAHIGPATSSESYLNIDRILDAARRHGVEAIHPGYGFLSENAAFRAGVPGCGIHLYRALAALHLFDGLENRSPPRSQIRRRTDRARPEPTCAEFAREAGLPVMLKAVAGGGGKGMRRVDRMEDLNSAFDAASSEAEARLWRRPYLRREADRKRAPYRNSVLGDQHGNLIHLGERECSVQRRHQKVIEESPSPLVASMPGMRERMGEAAVQGRARGRLLQRRNGGVPGRQLRSLLLPRDEHKAPGGASGHRTRNRTRPRAPADRNRGGRALAVHSGTGRSARRRNRMPDLCRRSRE